MVLCVSPVEAPCPSLPRVGWRRPMMFSDEELASAIAHSTAPRLMASPPTEPLPGQLRLAKRALDRAQARISLPRYIPLHWRSAAPDVCGGSCVLREDENSIGIYLNAEVMPLDLVRTVYHELQHVADYHAGTWRRLSRVEMERRAIRFADVMMDTVPLA